ncbi:aminotransferase class I/II-fold pyridoxal phosphate-dependent enzyme [Paenibacillus sp. IB182496]|uniref:homocysteine desulfhydrase n=1 Tax=Paenibacillus sabuli TaxID=2772509 RepID=A0A927GTU2_9BACL|nr:aminotransferase class I/II-fold pyridoxal phosphate-dependent enzyme [Paenibacillus sabuli]MBD2847052.1 aminotransferase class I/II-fold pyridoxal phosphate-dependent enzyme [Paenibacillus sabuli]
MTNRKQDICMHGGDDYDRFHGAVVPPIYQSSLYTRKTKNHGYTYSRVANPTVEVAERKLALLEEGEAALAFSSGMAAITAGILHYAKQGAHIVTLRSVYTPARLFLEDYLPRFGIETTLVSGERIEDFEAAIRDNTSLVYLESPVSNVFSLQDLGAIAELARSKGIATMVDNTYATPLYQNPLRLGIDAVVHSASKYLGGHSDLIGGVLIGSAALCEQMKHAERGMLGAVMDPQTAALLTRGLRTLPVRMAQHAANAAEVAQFLASHPAVERVYYPGLADHPQSELVRRQMSGSSGLMSFIPKADEERIKELPKALEVFEIGPSWGGFESLMNFPGVGLPEEALTHTGIPRGLVRISVGLESAAAIMEDLDRGLRRIART